STITINNVTGNQTNFKGYQIFKATVTDNNDGTKSVSDITWAGSTDAAKKAMQDAVEGVIKVQDSTYAGTTAQDAADWIKAHVTNTNKTTVVDSTSVPEALAKAVMGVTTATATTVTGGTASSTLDNGYWLFLTDPDSVDTTGTTKNSETYTSPIFAVVGGSAYTVTEKASIPTVEKKIVSDADNAEYDAADSHIGQNVRYNIYGTVAQDFATYDSYSYKFTDTVSNGLTVDSGSVKVYMYANEAAAKADVLHTSTSAIDVTSSFTSALADGTDGAHVLTVTAKTTDGLKGLKSISGATKDSCFVVTYTAQINSSAVIGNPGNPNEVTLEYSNNPNAEGTGKTVPDKVRDFTYGLNLVKLDQGTEKALAGAVFTIQVSGADDTATTNKYVAADGTLSDTAVNLTTDANGKIDVTGLDAGTYKVHEVSAPDGYSTVSDFTFTITPAINQNDQTVTLASTLNTTDSAHVIAGLSDATAGDNKLTPAANSGVTDNTTVNITVGDTKSVGLPLTGQAGVTLTWVAGGLVLAFGVSRVVRNRHENDAE
ncbi:MAG: SpaA isopeptide-forming pilin-related protein, partial [Atopobiaceae bacterium]